MEIKQSKYLPKQMNGPVICATKQAQDIRLENADAIATYLKGLTIDTADETELENIGRIIGYVRPLVPEGFNSENILLLGPLPLETDPEIGLATVDSEIGGQLSSTAVSDSNFMSLGVYRKFLKSIAILKRYGVTISAIDKIVSIINTNYTISYDENQDIVVHFNESIGFKNIWILTQIFYRIATAPQVLISSGL